jgi:murein DD-endopeptidase MepM/ murein hydrolase activator NlpD
MNWTQYPVTESFGQSYGGSVEHGVDIGTPFHTPITNLYGGVVTDVSRHGWGYQVGILTNLPGIGPVIEYFQHLDIPNVVKGQFVAAGQLVGLSGGQTSGGNAPNSTQYSSGAHTEFGFDAPWIGGVLPSMPKSFNPTSYLTGQGAGQCDWNDVQCNINAIGNIGNTAVNSVNATNDFLQKLQSPDFWVRTGLIVSGLLVIVIGLTLFVKDMQQ